ncbi:aflatoxin regulatory protein-domain-containing protein [Bisporella sp. PMI_857]|nr:aflatoxin regulatory protein-domain-containing protein [Bisporella sp. PMI_857]
MTTIHSPQQLPTPTSSSTSRRNTTAPAAPKLRDSCHACALSKLKCYKEKPTCSRCAKRGITCEYVATKRGGRKHSNRASINDAIKTAPATTIAIQTTNDVIQSLSPLDGWFTKSGTEPLSSPGIQSSPRSTLSNTSPSFFQNHGLSPSDQTLSSTVTMSTDLDEFFASPISFSMPDISDADILGQDDFFSAGMDSHGNGSESLFDGPPMFDDTLKFEAVSELLSFHNIAPRSPPNSRQSPAAENMQSYQPSRTLESPCFCLVRALGLMKQLFPNPSNSKNGDERTSIRTIQAVIQKNEHTVEAISLMLQCPCSQDSYLLAIMSLIVFKVLGWYAAAARRKPSNRDDGTASGLQSPISTHARYASHAEQVLQIPAAVGSYYLDGEDSTRMAAQLVLGELHRVQRLVNQLSAKLKLQSAKNNSGADTPNSLGYDNSEIEPALPLSAAMLDQLESDMRKRLRGLSLDIVECLRRE